MKPMRVLPLLALVVVSLGSSELAAAAEQSPLIDLSNYTPQPGLTATIAGRDELLVAWSGAADRPWRARMGLTNGVPTLRAIEYQQAGEWVILARDLRPEFHVDKGKRRAGGAGADPALRWDAYWDAPLNVPGDATGNEELPRLPEEIGRYDAEFRADRMLVRTEGARLEITFPAVTLGIFQGDFRWTIYRGSSLVRQEVIAKTDEDRVAYIYRGGLNGLDTADFSRVEWRDTGGQPQRYSLGGKANEAPVALRARHRLAVATGERGSVAVFPPPHVFFFPRQLEINLGFVWYRKDDDDSFAIGVRQHDRHEGYRRDWDARVWPLYNAPPGTWQRMAVYFHFSAADAETTRREAMAWTHDDRYKPLPGYQTMVTHFHTGFAAELMAAGNLDLQAPWIPPMRALDVNIVYLCDFHTDGHPRDPGPLRFAEQQAYFEACRRHSDRDFLIVPGEEPNAYLGGHYNVLFPRPVYWTMVRGVDQPVVEEHPEFGRVYHTSNIAEVMEMLEHENAIVWQTHPRSKASTGFPDRIQGTPHFQTERFIGGGFKPLPMDLSEPRVGQTRCFELLDDMNNWGGPKYLIGEVDSYKKFPDYDLYGDFNVNYVKLERLPAPDDFAPLIRALRAGEFFVSTGEVLIPEFRVERQGNALRAVAQAEWTFPLEFVEFVWGDGQTTSRKILSAAEHAPHASGTFEFQLPAAGVKWIRFAAWDSAANGAFTQPVHVQR